MADDAMYVRSRQLIRDFELAVARWIEQTREATERADAAEGELASATDLANSWARETSIPEARDVSGLRDLVDRLWGTLSGRYFKMQERAEKAERELAEARKDTERFHDALDTISRGVGMDHIKPCEVPKAMQDVACAAIDAALANKEG